jgi:hypothetical protein
MGKTRNAEPGDFSQSNSIALDSSDQEPPKRQCAKWMVRWNLSGQGFDCRQ